MDTLVIAGIEMSMDDIIEQMYDAIERGDWKAYDYLNDLLTVFSTEYVDAVAA
jgi:hypothetical protein